MLFCIRAIFVSGVEISFDFSLVFTLFVGCIEDVDSLMNPDIPMASNTFIS